MLCFIMPNKQVLHFEITLGKKSFGNMTRVVALTEKRYKKWCYFDVLKRLKERSIYVVVVFSFFSFFFLKQRNKRREKERKRR